MRIGTDQATAAQVPIRFSILRREVLAAREQTIALTPAEQRAFWDALNEPSRLTDAQKRLGAMMRGQS